MQEQDSNYASPPQSLNEHSLIVPEAFEHWIKVFKHSIKKFSNESTRRQLVAFISSMIRETSPYLSMSAASESSLGTLRQVIEGKLMNKIMTGLNNYIQQQLSWLSSKTEPDHPLINRLNLYLTNKTKKTSLYIRVAAVLSLHDLEEFGYSEDDILIETLPADLNSESRLIIPIEFVAQGYTRVSTSAVFDQDDKVQEEDSLGCDCEVIIVKDDSEFAKALVDPALMLIAEELSGVFDNCNIDMDSADAAQKLFLILNGANLR